jgi:glutamyl-tRNA synthetase
MPLDGTTTLNDLVRDEVTFENRLIDDFVILKSDGFPTYHLAHIVDDHMMKISHVLRSEEWLPSAPRHLQIYRAIGWEPPRFAHLPLILAPDRSKLSKRHGATSVLEYRQMGYVPDAMVNFLTLLGWSLDDKTEIFSRDELIKHFSIDRVARAGALFDSEKLNWMNGYYIRQMSQDELAEHLLNYWRQYPAAEIPVLPSKDELTRIVPLIQERLKTLADAAALIPFFFKDEIEFENDELVQKGMDADGTRAGLQFALDGLERLDSFDSDAIEHMLREQAKELNVKAGQHFGALRVATTGLRVSPPLFQSMEALGKERTISFIKRAIDKLQPSTISQK